MTDESARSPNPLIEYDPENGSILIWTHRGRATFKDGKWYPNILFSGDHIMEFFLEVRDQAEIERIMSEAEGALNESQRLESSRHEG